MTALTYAGMLLYLYGMIIGILMTTFEKIRPTKTVAIISFTSFISGVLLLIIGGR